MLTGVASRLTVGEVAREPRSLAVIAYFDGYAAGSGSTRRQTYPRRITRDEERSWRDGFTEGRTERVCHSWHGFVPHHHVGDHPLTVYPDRFPPMLRGGTHDHPARRRRRLLRG